jgi:predicted DNA-binding protein (UPF0251 family)
MSPKEVNRLEVMQRLDEKRLRQKAAAELVGVSERQVKRLLRRYRLSLTVLICTRHSRLNVYQA